jgi:hypothetical protein
VEVALESSITERFDAGRALLSKQDILPPFRVRGTRSLRGALDHRVLPAGTRVLVVERTTPVLALRTDQMTFHHVAQGEMRGQPWMVSF